MYRKIRICFRPFVWNGSTDSSDDLDLQQLYAVRIPHFLNEVQKQKVDPLNQLLKTFTWTSGSKQLCDAITEDNVCLSYNCIPNKQSNQEWKPVCSE